MNKRLLFIFGGAIFLLLSAFSGILLYDKHLYKLEGLGLYAPNNIGGYRNVGYFKIDPKTILVSLEGGDTNVFMPLKEEDVLDLEEITNLSIYWNQEDFLKIAGAMGQFVWDDPMNLNNWRVYSIIFEGNCGDPIGLYYASITYFKTMSNSYFTRLIEIEPHYGWIGWGNGNIYSQPILRKWKSVDLARAKITADGALKKVNEDIKVNFQIVDNTCGVIIGSSSHQPKNWDFNIFRGSLDPIFSYAVNLDTGDLIIKNNN